MTNWQPSGGRPAVVLANNFTNRSNEHLSPRLAFSRQIVNEQVESRWCSIERKGRRVFLEKMEKICENEFLVNTRDMFPDQFPEQSLDKPTIPRKLLLNLASFKSWT